ncbi:MAG: hypothetical protein CSA84_05475 [Actinomycetales bacterium]|nr:MAG: hypothetical protein CSA84_05475 [Actinomycetales bacterium]
MTATGGTKLSAVDKALLHWLSRVTDTADPEPAHLRELGRLALSVRRVDAQLAEVVADSELVLDCELVGAVRSGAEASRVGQASPRMVSFEIDDVAIEVQITDLPDGREILGVVDGLIPSDGARVDLETGRAERASCSLDEFNRFEFSAVARGLVRFRVVADPVDVTTDWLTV